jgi:ATP-dependent 26S proteasome regulatory subunit
VDSSTEAPSATDTNSSWNTHGLTPELRRLDVLLARAVVTAREAHATGDSQDPYRGLHVSEDEVVRLLARPPGVPLVAADGADSWLEPWEPETDGAERFAWLQSAFGLTAFDLDVVLLLLAPEIDLRYERLYAYLQDDVTRKRPTIDLVLNVLCASASDRLSRRAHFLPEGPLFRSGLAGFDEAHATSGHELSRPIYLDEQIVHLLLGLTSLDGRLTRICRIHDPADPTGTFSLDPETMQALASVVSAAFHRGRPLRLHLFGLVDRDRLNIGRHVASALNVPLLVADLSRVTNYAESSGLFRLLFREAWFRGALLYFDRLDSAVDGSTGSGLGRDLVDHLREDAGITFLSSAGKLLPESFRGLSLTPVQLKLPGFEDRHRCWQTALVCAGIHSAPDTVDALASRFRLTPSQIEDAVQSAVASAEIQRRPDETPVQNEALFSAAQDQTSMALSALTSRVDPVATWDDIVLPADTVDQLREICSWVIHRERVLHSWGFDRKLSRGKGVAALFTGASGTGKSMAAEVIANELRLDLYRIDLSGVVSKYIGETEKNLDRIFRAAEDSNAILFFDEADAIFGKRSEVRDSHDRYANIEISYLLQKMEEYDGVTILTTNLRQNLDDAFVRRLGFIIQFPFPDEPDRRQIWTRVWPVKTPLAHDVDLDALASGFKLSGGNIRNIALAGAYLAASEGDPVGMSHLVRTLRREFQKLGKTLTQDEIARVYRHSVQDDGQDGGSV